MKRLGRPELLLPQDIGLNFLKCPCNILFIFKIFSRVPTQIAFEFHLSFQNLREHHGWFFFPIGYIFFEDFPCPFLLLGDEYTGIP